MAADGTDTALGELNELIRTRIENLRPKLLDLSRRNPLISTRLSARSNSLIRVVDELPDVLAFYLCGDQQMRFLPLPSLEENPRDEETREFQDALSNGRRVDEIYLDAIQKLDVNDDESMDLSRQLERELRDRIRSKLGMAARQKKGDVTLVQHALNNGIAPSYELPDPKDENEDGRHQDQDIQTLHLPDDLERKLNSLSTKCRTWIQETGINVLHAAFGFLEWTEPGSTESAFAPLVLLPVEIERIKTREGTEFWVKASGEDAETNLVLAEKMRLEFGIDVPQFQGGSIEQYLQEVGEASPKTMKWKVRRQAAFGIFPSARMAMYQDLDTTKTKFESSDILSRLFGGGNSGDASPFSEEYEVDQPEIESKVPSLVLDADSSQFSTIVDVSGGKNLAVEGPPGTGKSQTIVNTIAAAIANGKKVLFIAEKMAALEVVKVRLEAVGLGEFLLPLQAGRSTREQVVNSIRARLVMDAGQEPRDYDAKVARYRQVRSELAAYIGAVSSPFGQSGLTAYDILGKCISGNSLLADAPRELQSPTIGDVERWDRLKLEAIREVGAALEKAWVDINQTASYWTGLKTLGVDRFSVDRLTRLAEEGRDAFDKASKARARLDEYGIHGSETREHLEVLLKTLDALGSVFEKLDVQLISRIHNAACLPAIVDYLEACRLCHDDADELARIVNDPADPELSRRLREIYSSCQDSGIATLDPAKWKEVLEGLDEALESNKKIFEVLKPFIEVFPAAASTPIDVIRQAGQLVQDEQRRVLVLRSEATAEASVASLIKQLLRTGYELLERRREIEKVISPNLELSAAEIKAHAASLQRAGWFGWLKPSVRSATRTYIAHSRREDFKKDAAAQDFHELAEWKAAERAFAELDQAKMLFGIHFRGIDTDFEQFDCLVTYYEVVEEKFAGIARRDIRKLLKVGDVELLLSIPKVPNGAYDGAFSELAATIELQELEVSRCRAAFDKVQSLSTSLKRPAQCEVATLPSLADKVDRLAEVRAGLHAHPIAKAMLLARFSGADTNPSYFEYDIRALAALAEYKKFSTTILDLLATSRIREAANAIRHVLEAERAAEAALSEVSERSGISFGDKLAGKPYAEVAQIFDEASTDTVGIYAHSAYATTYADLQEHKLGWVVDTLLRTNKPLDQLANVLEAVVFRAMAMCVYETHGKVLSRYSGATLDVRRAALARQDREIIKLSRQRLRAKTFKASRPPRGNGTGKKSTWTDMALIENETTKKKRFVPVRDLTRRAGAALLELKPCWMMSPLAVAQYLPLGSLTFDLCIIDEASQMPPEDAVGALVRSKQTMVVGDTNQLPPTSFFRKMLDDDDADEDETVLDESILEMANGAFRPARRLRWHYRSRHSALIRFSNEHVYDNDLIVFPSASEGRADQGISLVSVRGRYHAGINSDEASAMIEAALHFMHTNPGRSLGIVTLNQKQRDLLLEEMETALARDTLASKYVEEWSSKNDGLESFFIKNLENVQGDERDVIFIGTVYGPEKVGGPVMQRFGPINGLAGKRRLNVLFSRAKEQIVTFSSMTAADITAEEQGNPGTYMLKRWLEYSATGVIHAGISTGKEPDSDFEVFVINQIRSMGCIPVPQVGVSGYFVDIGVRHPDWPHGFIMGVECDGAAYHSSRSARDRDRLREEVLTRLGWKLHRIWSTDWFNDPAAQARRLRAAIESRMDELRTAGVEYLTPKVDDTSSVPISTVPSPTTDSVAPSSSAVELANDHKFIEIGDTVSIRYLTGPNNFLEVTLSDKRNDPSNGIVHVGEPLGSALLSAEEGDEIEVLVGNLVRRALIERVVKGKPEAVDGAKRTEPNVPPPQIDNGTNRKTSDNVADSGTSLLGRGAPKAGPRLNPDRFYELEYRDVVQSLGTEFIDRLGPLTFKHLSDLIARAHGFQRTGSQIKKQVWAAVSRIRQSSRTPNGETVFWPHGVAPVLTFPFRTLTVKDDQRVWSDVPYPERLGLAVEVLQAGSSEDPAAEISARIGYTRLREATRGELEALVVAAREFIASTRD